MAGCPDGRQVRMGLSSGVVHPDHDKSVEEVHELSRRSRDNAHRSVGCTRRQGPQKSGGRGKGASFQDSVCE